MDYTLEDLYQRRNELEEMNEEIEAEVSRWVGSTELDRLDAIYERYGFDPDDWFSDLYLVEKAVERLEMERD